MSASDGDVSEMPVPPLDDDRALDALLNGGSSAQPGLDWLLPFVADLEKASQEPAPVVRPALALLLQQGFSPESGTAPAAAPQGAVPTGAAPAATGPATAAMPPSPSTERPFLRPVLRGALSRAGGLSLLAKAGLGLGLIAASSTAAGAAGVLPGPAQHVVATVVGAATPFSFPDKASDKADHGRTVSSDATGASDGVRGVDGGDVSGAVRATPSTSAGGGTTTGDPVGPSTGATGLDRANETPAAGHVPTSVPGHDEPAVTPGAKGQETSGSTPAATRPAPTSKPATPPATASPSATNRGTTTTVDRSARP